MTDSHDYDSEFSPNMLSFEMGKRIRQAREEAGLTQERLARLLARRQASLSAMENGKMEPDAGTLMGLSLLLKKPITYFFPVGYTYAPEIEASHSEEVRNLIDFFTGIANEDYRQLALSQVETIMNYDQQQRGEEWRKAQRNQPANEGEYEE